MARAAEAAPLQRRVRQLERIELAKLKARVRDRAAQAEWGRAGPRRVPGTSKLTAGGAGAAERCSRLPCALARAIERQRGRRWRCPRRRLHATAHRSRSRGRDPTAASQRLRRYEPRHTAFVTNREPVRRRSHHPSGIRPIRTWHGFCSERYEPKTTSKLCDVPFAAVAFAQRPQRPR